MRPGITFVITVLLSACQTGGEVSSSGSASGAISGLTTKAIADDMASRLAERMPQATTVIRLRQASSDYSTALEAALKVRGYTVVTDGSAVSGKAVELQASIEQVDDQFLAQISTSSTAIAQAYQATATGASPSSALSIFTRN